MPPENAADTRYPPSMRTSDQVNGGVVVGDTLTVHDTIDPPATISGSSPKSMPSRTTPLPGTASVIAFLTSSFINHPRLLATPDRPGQPATPDRPDQLATPDRPGQLATRDRPDQLATRDRPDQLATTPPTPLARVTVLPLNAHNSIGRDRER